MQHESNPSSKNINVDTQKMSMSFRTFIVLICGIAGSVACYFKTMDGINFKIDGTNARIDQTNHLIETQNNLILSTRERDSSQRAYMQLEIDFIKTQITNIKK